MLPSSRFSCRLGFCFRLKYRDFTCQSNGKALQIISELP
jgi:hypothetical protein